MKKLLSLFLAVVMALSLCTTAFAGNTAGTSVIRLTGDAADQVVDLKNGQRLSADSSTLVRLNVLDDPSAEEYTVTLDGEKLEPDHSTSQYHFYAVPAAQASGIATLNVSSGVSTQALEGDGTAENPYQIATADDLKAFRDKVNGGEIAACAKLTADIKLDKNEDWTPIGTSDKMYAGTFDGQGHTISGMKVSSAQGDCVGLFGVVNDGAVIQDLTIADSSIDGTHDGSSASYAAAFVANTNMGVSAKVTLNNCHVAKSVTLTTANASCVIGGLVGTAQIEISLDSCSNQADVTVTVNGKENSSFAGGLIGRVRKTATLKDCFSSGNISAKAKTSVGGLIGQTNYSGTVALTNVYCTGNVTSDAKVEGSALGVSGLIGMVQGNTTITNAYFAGTAKNGSEAGFGICAANASYGTSKAECTKVYTTAATAGTSTKVTGATVRVSVEDMKAKAEALGEGFKADFAGIKSINNGYPLLAWQLESGSSGDATIKGTGTADDPYQITSAEDLAVFRDKVNGGSTDACAKLMNDITLNAAEEWTPIGNGSSSAPDGYTGTFDGDGHTISGLKMTSAAEKSGFIGTAGDGAVIKNLTISDSTFTVTDRYIGAFVGYTEGKITLSNCHTAADVTVTGGRDAGGLVGGSATANSWFTMDGCSNAATVTGTVVAANYSVGVGGLIGTAYWGAEITNSCNTGKVQATGTTSIPAGGLVGYANANYPKPEKSLILTNVYNTGAVVSASANTNEANANGLAGGLVGYAKWGFTITNAYSTMTAKLSNGNAYGGVIVGCIPTRNSTGDGNKTPDVTLSGVYAASVDDDSYIVSQINANKLSAVQKVSDDDMKARAMAAKLGNGFAPDFGKANGGYPVLAWQAVADPDTVDNFNTAGTEEAPYRIATADGLKKFRDIVNANDTSSGGPGAKACAVLVADIALDKSEKWTAIGTLKTKYTGTFDGNGHTISGVVMKGSSDVGLFITATSNTAPVIKNLTIADSSFTTTRGDAGAFVGWGGGVFENCHTTDNVVVKTDSNGSAGGIVGMYAAGSQSDPFTINQCSNRAAVTSATCSGGIIGKLNKGQLTMEKCFNAGTMTGGTAAGGLVGDNAGNDGNTMTDVYNVGNVSSEKGTNVGGLFGTTSKTVTIKNAYQHSTVANKNGTGAAIVGNTSAAITLVNVYKTGSLNDSLTGSSITGKAVTKTEAELKELAAQLGGSFIKDMVGDAAVNNGFPIFRWQNPVAASADTLKVTAKDQSGTAALDSEGSTDPKNPTEKTISFECGFLNTFAADRIYLNPGAENTGTVELGLALSDSGELTRKLTKQKNGYTADELYFYRLPGEVTHTVYAVHTQDGTARYYKINIQRTAISTTRYGAISADWRDDNPVIQTTYNANTGYLDATVKVSDYFARYTNGVLDETNKATGFMTYDKEFKYYGYDLSILDNDGNQSLQFANVGRFWIASKPSTDSFSSIPAAVWWGSKDVADKYIDAANALKAEAGYSKLPTELKSNFDAAIKAVSDGWNEDTAKPLYLDANGSYTTKVTELKARDAMGAPMTGEYKLEYQENLLLDYMYIIKTYLNDSTLGSLKYRALQNVVKGVNNRSNKYLQTVSAMAITDDETKSNYEYYYQRVWRIVNATDIGEINTMLNDLNLSKVELDITSDAMQVIVGNNTYDVDLSKAVNGTVTINVPRSEAMQRIYFTRPADVTIKSPTMEALQGKGAYTGTDFGLYFYNTPAEQTQNIKISVNENGTVNEYTIAIVCPAADGVVLGPSGTGGNYREDQPGNMGSVDTSGEYYAYGFVIGSDGTTIYDGMKLYTNGERSGGDIRPDWTSLEKESNKLYYANGIYAYFARPGYYWLPVTTTVDGKTVEGLLPMRASWTRDAVANYLKYAEATEPPVRGSMSDEAQELYAQVYNTVEKAAGTSTSTSTLGTPLYLTINGDVPTTTASATTVRARSYFGAPLYGASLIEKDMNTLLDLTYMCANTWSTNAELAEKQFAAYQKILNMDGGIHSVMEIHSTADRDLYQKIRQAKWDLIHTTDAAGINAILTKLGLETITPTEPEYTLGDINGDNVIDLNDVSLALDIYYKDVTPTDEQKLAADVNGDSVIDLNDVSLILDFYYKDITQFPAAKS